MDHAQSSSICHRVGRGLSSAGNWRDREEQEDAANARPHVALGRRPWSVGDRQECSVAVHYCSGPCQLAQGAVTSMRLCVEWQGPADELHPALHGCHGVQRRLGLGLPKERIISQTPMHVVDVKDDLAAEHLLIGRGGLPTSAAAAAGGWHIGTVLDRSPPTSSCVSGIGLHSAPQPKNALQVQRAKRRAKELRYAFLAQSGKDLLLHKLRHVGTTFLDPSVQVHPLLLGDAPALEAIGIPVHEPVEHHSGEHELGEHIGASQVLDQAETGQISTSVDR
mmetsp:Transcript_105369/g.296748  ORF Transcript_105369/g.296748 Transcript_105369/m.296748 type:complete len:279 (+) Transcript_105369:262-1098(+)